MKPAIWHPLGRGSHFLRKVALAYGLNFSYSVFFVAILEEFKWSRGSIAGAFSLSSFIVGVGSFPMGRLVDGSVPGKS